MKNRNNIDETFLNKLLTAQEREVFARITALTFSEKAIEYIEGKITGGSISVDGQSAVRRTCSLTMVAQDVKINEFYWGLKNKFKLEIGLKNKVDSNYSEIIWFKQGIFIITSFSTSQSTNSYNINISGKDKMCLLNGDIAGALPHTTDFGVEEFVNELEDGTLTTIYESVPIKRIIYQSLQTFGNELPQNIIINDIEDYGLDLLEYRGDIPIYLFKAINADVINQMTLNNNQPCWINGKQTKINQDTKEEENYTLNDITKFDTMSNLQNSTKDVDIIQFSETGQKYTVVKLEYGMNAGYRTTELIYAGDLIANVGETLTSVYDKIKNMLGDFEYFYDIDGRFVFQRKRTYINTPFNSLSNSNQEYADAAINTSSSVFNLLDGKLVTSFQNTPNLLNLRNDFTVWGKKKTASGSELDIHMRYAIDVKPHQYKSLLDGKVYSTTLIKNSKNEIVICDWREIIYRMALDYRRFYFTDENFLINLAAANPQYPTGKTGYEQYYIDLEGFWKLLYDLEGDEDTYYQDGNNKYWNKEVFENPENLIFWFDFLDAEQSDLSKYSVQAVGDRTKVINDNDVKKIYYRDIPDVIFVSSNETINNRETGYTYLQLQQGMESLFTISSKGKSCKERIDELLYDHSYCIENVSITTLPIYHLQPNVRILVRDDKSNISGEYLVNKITIPLTYNGTMNITATKSVASII